MYSGDEYYDDEVTSPTGRSGYASRSPEHAYIAWLGRVDARLDAQYGIETWDMEYDWHRAFIIGMEPSEAILTARATPQGEGES